MTNQEKMDLAKKQLKHCLNSKDCQTCEFWNKGEAMIVCQQLVLSCFEISGLIKNNEEAGFWKFISDNTVVCSNCGQEFSGHDDYEGCKWNFCPNCGKKMNKNMYFKFMKDSW